jgi:spermidine/putrescine transport system permease protein
MIVYYSFQDAEGQWSLHNFHKFFLSTDSVNTLIYSIGIAMITTILCILLGYPAAYFMAKTEYRLPKVMASLFILPMWINVLLRTLATVALFDFAHLPLGEGALVFGMVYNFLPFMILPIYTTISRLDGALREAAMDLGADSVQTFLRVTLPLSVPGIISGVSMVFLPAMTNYVILDMLYNSTYIMGSLIGSYFSAYNWHGGSMIALILLAIICIFTLLTRGMEDDSAETRVGGALL